MPIQINFDATPSNYLSGLPIGYSADNQLTGSPIGGGQTPSQPTPGGPGELPRLASQPSVSFSVVPPSVSLEVTSLNNGVIYNLSEYVVSYDYALILNGASQGVVNLRHEDLSFLKAGMIVTLSYQLGETIRKVFRAYILEPPTRSGTGINPAWSIRVGDIFAWAAIKKPEATLYCGANPTTIGEAVRLYATQRNLRLPNGQTIVVPNGQTVPNLNIYRPDIDFWTFCSGLYNPLGYDVGTNNEGEIVVQQRKTLANQEAPSLNNFIAASQQQTSTTVYSTLTVQSEYDVNLGFTFTETETERIINPGSTGKPWFLGGRMVVQKTSQVIGDTEVYYIEKTYGEIPVNPTGTIPTTNDPCAPLPTIATQYGLITTKTFRLTYSDIGAGAYLISTLREYSEGKQAIIEDSTYTIVDGPISEHREDYTNTVQPSALVCPKNQIYLQTRIVISDYAPKEPGDELWLIRGELVTYSVTTSGPVDGVSYAGFAQSWLKSTTLSERDSNDFWQTQPTIRTPEAPPNSKWVRPEIRSYIIQATVRIPLLENLYGVSTAPDINSNGIFSLESANLYARRWLLEQAGYQQSISIIVPFFTSFTNGQLINLGNGYIGLVIASEINVGGGIANKTLTIMKLYE